MSEFSHRTVKEIKQFLKKYNSHFRIKVTKKRKAQLLDEMREGMKKEITPELKADYEKLLEEKKLRQKHLLNLLLNLLQKHLLNLLPKHLLKNL